MSIEDPLGKLILLVGAVLPFVAAQLIDTGDTTQATLEWVRGHHIQAYIAMFLALLAVPFLLGGVVLYWISARDVSRRLGLLAAVSLMIGYVGVAAQDGSQALAFTLAADQSVDLTSLAKGMGANTLPHLAEQIMAFGGWLLGLLLALPRLRSPYSTLAALSLLSVPFTLRIDALELAGPIVLFAAALLLTAVPIARTRLRAS